jgi:hypothetical protein
MVVARKLKQMKDAVGKFNDLNERIVSECAHDAMCVCVCVFDAWRRLTVATDWCKVYRKSRAMGLCAPFRRLRSSHARYWTC